MKGCETLDPQPSDRGIYDEVSNARRRAVRILNFVSGPLKGGAVFALGVWIVAQLLGEPFPWWAWALALSMGIDRALAERARGDQEAQRRLVAEVVDLGNEIAHQVGANTRAIIKLIDNQLDDEEEDDDEVVRPDRT